MKQELPVFSGFTTATVKFLEKLTKNNNRDWFAEHKTEYENEVKLKAQSLILALEQAFAVAGLPYMADIKKSMFRINRDTRFSKNKDPYKTNLGLFFPYKAEESGHRPVEAAGLYYHLEPGESFIAGGLYMPMPDQLKAIREKIANDWEELEVITNDKKFKKEFPKMFYSESLKRVPAGYPQDHPAAEWLKMKGFTAYCDIDFTESYTPKLVKLIINKAAVAMPFHEFLHRGQVENRGMFK